MIASEAQVITLDGTTATPIEGAGHDYIHMLTETVDPSGGSVSVRIELPTPTSRGTTIPVSLFYTSSGTYQMRTQPGSGFLWSPGFGPFSAVGWGYGLPMLTAAGTNYQLTDNLGQTHQCTVWSNYNFQGPSSSRHLIPISLVYGSQADCSIAVPSPVSFTVTSGSDDFYLAATTANSTGSGLPGPTTVAGQQRDRRDGQQQQWLGRFRPDGHERLAARCEAGTARR